MARFWQEMVWWPGGGPGVVAFALFVFFCRRGVFMGLDLKVNEGSPADIIFGGWNASSLDALAVRYAAFLRESGLSPDTSDSHLGFLRRRVFPYFLGTPVPPYRYPPGRSVAGVVSEGTVAAVGGSVENVGPRLVGGEFAVHGSTSVQDPAADPAGWRGRSAGLCKWIIGLGDSAKSVSAANGALRGFLKWLWEEGVVHDKIWENLPLRIAPKSMRNLPTPLGRALSPAEVLEFCATRRSEGDNETALICLLGYFMSLRPQEIYAIRAVDFVLGDEISSSAEGMAMAAAGLHAGLGVDVWRQREDRKGEFLEPKSSSCGLVACFDEAAAKAIEVLVSEMSGGSSWKVGGPRVYGGRSGVAAGSGDGSEGSVLLDEEDLLFPRKPGKIMLRWRRRGIEGVRLKDLRRASILWLGGMTKLSPAAIMGHSRHRHFETTELYLRRPASGRAVSR